MSDTIVHAPELSTGLAAVWHAVAVEEYRPVLTTVCFEQSDAGLRLVTADNYRIALYDVRLADESSAEQFATRALLHRESVKLLRAFLRPLKGPVTITRTEELIRFAWRSGAIEFRLMDGTFPDYAKVIPGPRVPVVALNPRLLMESAAAFDKASGETLTLQTAGPLAPFVLRAKGCPLVTVVMPVRTGDAYETPPKRTHVKKAAVAS